MKNKKMLNNAYSVLNKISKEEQKEFIAKAILFYNDYLENKDEEAFYSKEDVKHVLYDLIKDGEVDPLFIKEAIYDIRGVDKRQEEISCYIAKFLR